MESLFGAAVILMKRVFFFHFLQLRDRVHIAHHDPGPQDPFPVRLMDDSMTRAAMSE